MPTTTFLNLPVEKQERLLEAAVREFSRQPFSEASINQIIKDAGIPRGSFYMYFTDKEELFRYLMSGYVDQLLRVVEACVLQAQGDIFAALLNLYDYIQRRQDGQQLGSMGSMTAIIGCNSGMQKSILMEMLDRQRLLERIGGVVNPDLLDLRQEGDLAEILAVLLSVSGPMIYDGLQGRDPAAVRARLANVLELLKRGMAKEKTPVPETIE